MTRPGHGLTSADAVPIRAKPVAKGRLLRENFVTGAYLKLPFR